MKFAKLCGVIAGVLLYVLSMGPAARWCLYPMHEKSTRVFDKIYFPVRWMGARSPRIARATDWYVLLWDPAYDLFSMPIVGGGYPIEYWQAESED